MKYLLYIISLMIFLGGCTHNWAEIYHSESQRVVSASLMDYLQDKPNKLPKYSTPRFWQNDAPTRRSRETLQASAIGIAFVPGNYAMPGMSEARKVELMHQVKREFEQVYSGTTIQVIPQTLIRSRGGFSNLSQVGKTYQLQYIALISFDQTLHAEDNELATLNWTGVGAMLLPGSQFQTETLVDISMFQLKDQRLLLHATGTDDQESASSLFSSVREIRRIRYHSFQRAFERLLNNLTHELSRT
jgi:rhombotail lipoprotein